ncbi:hypothetical protein AB0J20_24735 [Micromonospora costi]|uniref:hypothetical protein n=1 Tax=Micromonospora costi TaxID=1530042 RepID=UPI0033FFC5AC
MGCRRRDARPRVALWMLVALGDAVLLLAGIGTPALIALLSVVAVTAAAVCAWRVSRSGPLVREDPLPARVAVPVGNRRRA